MPLLPGKANVGRNISTEMKAGKGRRQSIAIALNVARRSRASGGPVRKADGGHTDPGISNSAASSFLNPLTSEILRRSVLPSATSWATDSIKPLLTEATPGNIASTALTTMPMVGPVAKAMELAARYAKPALGAGAGLGALLGPGSASSGGPGPEEEIARLSKEKDALATQRDAASSQYLTVSKSHSNELTGKGATKNAGKGPVSDALNQDAQGAEKMAADYNKRIDDIDSRIKTLQYTMTPDYKRDQDLAAANVNARKPWYERTGIPGFETAATWGPSIAAAALARGKFNAITDEGTNLLSAAKAAPSVAEEARARVALDAWRRSAGKDAAKAAFEAALVPGGIRTTGNIGDAIYGPEVKDAQGNVLPGGAKQQARQQLGRMFGSEGWQGAGEEWGPQALQGAEAVAAGALLSKRPPLGDINSQTAYLKGINNPEASRFGRSDATTMSPDSIALELAKRRGGAPSGSPSGPTPLWSQSMRGEPTNPALPPPTGLGREYPGSPTTSSQTGAEELGSLPPPSATPPAPNGAVEKALTVAKSPPQSPGALDLGSSEKLPPGLARDVNGLLYDKHTGQKVFERYAKSPEGTGVKTTPARAQKQPGKGKDKGSSLTDGPQMDENGVWIKPDKEPDPNGPGNFSSGGGVLGKALRLAKKYAAGGGITPYRRPVTEGENTWMRGAVPLSNSPDDGLFRAPIASGTKDLSFDRNNLTPEEMQGLMHSRGREFANGGTVGPLIGNTGGRSDKLARSVPPGSHVIPADVVGHLGEGNSLRGLEVLKQKYGTVSRSSGGEVPVMLSDGEYVVPPEAVMRAGGGDMERGHAAIDRDILATRNHAIETLRSLPPPSR